MRLTLVGMVTLALVAIGRHSSAIPPTFCHESMNGVLFSSVSGAFTSAVRLAVTVRNDEGDLALSGRYHCKRDPKHLERCTGSGTEAGIDGLPLSSLSILFPTQYDIRLFDPHSSGFTVLCELKTAPPMGPCTGASARS